MNSTEAALPATAAGTPGKGVIITALGMTQILAWGSSYYLPAVLANPIAADTGWSMSWVVGGLSLGLVTAAVISPRVGSLIQRRGGRPMLAASAGLLAAGLIGLSAASSIPLYMAAWIVVGLGMGAGLYDPAFATLGRLYGGSARSAITALTLFGGFASSVCWPLSALLEAHLGWRWTCLAYAAIHLAISLPTYLLLLPAETGQASGHDAPAARPIVQPGHARRVRTFTIGLLAGTLTLSAMLSTLMSVHLLAMLQSRGLAPAAAVTLGTLVGPSQVGARFIELMIARYHHPIWTKMTSTVLVAAGLSALWMKLPIVAAALMLYGAGIGLESIARGTLPLALFGAADYPAIMGRLALPSLTGQAAAPLIGAFLMERGADTALAAVSLAAVANVLIAIGLLTCFPGKREGRI